MVLKPNFPYNRTYPTAPAPNDDISAIGGNCTLEQKQQNVNILAYFLGADDETLFGRNELKDMKLVEMDVYKRKIGSSAENSEVDALEGRTVCEIEVKKGTGSTAAQRRH